MTRAILLASLVVLVGAQGAAGAILPTAHVGASAEAVRYARSQAKLERSRERVQRLEKRLREARKRIGALEAAVSVSSLPPPTSSPAVTGGAAASSAPSGCSGSTNPYVSDPCTCEGQPATNTGNGYGGKYQFDVPTWNRFAPQVGAPQVSSTAGIAAQPQSVQDAVASVVTYDAWPHC